ncbi:hypothetical protein TrLO_g3623 [Triparma laevis f. longispina]|uniref:Uncharacterized protein n=1 Tax=Triparma laevis f. longispina TaxID=1714387 RepID=A0A9W7KZB4_9STRA|nr:hypothetical protein TrLO_g3623 [Triparma laevis f. longispina]
MYARIIFLLSLAIISFSVHSWIPVARPQTSTPLQSSASSCARSPHRRSIFLLPFLVAPTLAQASGGATAGGAYLLSAKQRYNERVQVGSKKFIILSKFPEPQAIKEFFAEESCYKDYASAGYLLANAFRRSSSTAPDKLPAVQKWKAFAKEAELIGKKPKSANFVNALQLLDEYLSEVELPPAAEL